MGAIYDGNHLPVFEDIRRVNANYPGLNIANLISEALRREYVEELDI